MAREFARALYKSTAWQHCRDSYAKSKGGLCERCLAKGIIRPGSIVHHKKYLTPSNINDPNVTLNWDNLELLCRDCHAEEHLAINDERYDVDQNGNVVSRKDDIPPSKKSSD